MKQIAYVAFCTFFAYTLGGNCDKFGILLYEDLACRPQETRGPCPTSYDCGDLRVPNKCVVQGKIYNPGEIISKNSIGFSCEFGCRCGASSNRSSVSCAQGFCAAWLPISRPSPGCYNRYTLKQCCPEGENCPPFEDTKCTVDGVEHRAGERFSSKDSCHVCVCQRGFNGKFVAPYCIRRGCDAQKKNQDEVQKSCAPVYIKRDANEILKCCPSLWTCPNGSEVIESGGKKFDLRCKFGERTLSLGDSFEKEIQYRFRPVKVRCTCEIPPLLTCSEA